MAGVVPPPSFHRDVLPILRTACLGCHAAPAPAAGFSLASYAELMKGGKSGPVVLAGKSGSSRLVQMLTGAVKPQMPPVGALKASDIDILRRWVDAGAKDDPPVPSRTGIKTATANDKPIEAPRPAALGRLRQNTPAPVTALAFSPDGKTVAVGTYGRVLLCDPVMYQIRETRSGLADQVRSLTFSRDGKWLAAGSGISGASGEVRLWSVNDPQKSRLLHTQTDSVSAVAFAPDGNLLAAASLDKSIQLWETATGKPLQTLRDHADGVLGLSFRSDGKYLASCSADKSVKIWDTATWKRLYSVAAHDEPVTAVAFANGESPFVSASADRTVKVWNFSVDNSSPARTLGGHTHSVLSVAISPDGQIVASGSADKSVRLWKLNDGAEVATFTDVTDWVYSVAFSPDGKHLAAGTWDGNVCFWNLETKKREGILSTVPQK